MTGGRSPRARRARAVVGRETTVRRWETPSAGKLSQYLASSPHGRGRFFSSRYCARSPGAWSPRGPRSGGRAGPCSAWRRRRRTPFSSEWAVAMAVPRGPAHDADMMQAFSRLSTKTACDSNAGDADPPGAAGAVAAGVHCAGCLAHKGRSPLDLRVHVRVCDRGRDAPLPGDVLLLTPMCAFAKTRRQIWEREGGVCAPRGWARVFRALAVSSAPAHPTRGTCERVYAIRLRALLSRSFPVVPWLPKGGGRGQWRRRSVRTVRPTVYPSASRAASKTCAARVYSQSVTSVCLLLILVQNTLGRVKMAAFRCFKKELELKLEGNTQTCHSHVDSHLCRQ